MPAINIYKWFRGTGLMMFFAGVLLSWEAHQTLASEKVIFRYGGASQSISLDELQTFANTGEISPALDFLLQFGKQNPLTIRWILTQQFPANTQVIYDLLNTAPGEYVLSQTGNVVTSKSERANIQALRGALIASASDDNLISLMELLEEYPTKEVYVDGKILAKAQRNLANFINETNRYIKIPLSFLAN